jgi:hypothetical protein
MAVMIPPVVYKGCSSPGEAEIFRRLRDDPETRGWTVLHSLDIAKHRRQISGEADFVVIIPSRGVLVLEVKAAHSVRRTSGGQWYYGANPKPDPRGPFKQASEAMHSIRDRAVSQDRSLSRAVFWSAVIFPYAPFNAVSGEWHPWQVIDSSGFRANPVSSLLEQVIGHARAFLKDKSTAAWFRPDSDEPDTAQCQAIAEALRPAFEFFESPKSLAQRREEELKYYTREQAAGLDAMEANHRVLFSGPAGTGKTLLAVEAARRAHAQGRRVLLVCYNRLLGRWLEEQAAELQPGVTCGTLHSRMIKVSGLERIIEECPQDFWESGLPLLAMEKMLEEPQDTHLFDELVIDEAQDILREEYLDFLDLSLRGGLAAGRWRMFGDFENQAIYGAAGMPLQEFLQTRTAGAPVYSLRVNCRNTPRVAEYVHLLGGLKPRYSRILRPDDGIRPGIRYYKGKASQQEILTEALGDLYGEGFRGQDITVLSAKSDVASCAASITGRPWKDRLRPAGKASGGQIAYSSIRRFKGMEAPAVIVTDVEEFGGPESTALFYVAVTRALHKLIVLVHESAKEAVKSRVIGVGGDPSGEGA